MQTFFCAKIGLKFNTLNSLYYIGIQKRLVNFDTPRHNSMFCKYIFRNYNYHRNLCYLIYI